MDDDLRGLATMAPTIWDSAPLPIQRPPEYEEARFFSERRVASAAGTFAWFGAVDAGVRWCGCPSQAKIVPVAPARARHSAATAAFAAAGEWRPTP